VKPIFSYKVSPKEDLGRIDFRSNLLNPKKLTGNDQNRPKLAMATGKFLEKFLTVDY
jgi:hypothetical protein